MFEEGARILNYINNNYDMLNVIEQNKYITSIPVSNGDKSVIRLYAQNGFAYPLSKYEQSVLKVEYDFPKSVDAPIKQENIIGKINIFLDKHLLFSTNICTIDNVELVDKKNELNQIIQQWF